MELVIKTYGKFLAEGIVVVLLLGLLFWQLDDGNGNRGILHIMGAHFEAEQTDMGEYVDFQSYQSEGKRSAPVISYNASNALYTGTYSIAEYITAVDDAGAALAVRLLGMWDPFGAEVDVTGQNGNGEMVLEYPGIYTIKVAAADAGNKRTVCLIQIPVNRQKG